MGQSTTGEQRQLLPPDQAVHQIDGRDSGLQKLAWRLPGCWFDRETFDPERPLCRQRRAVVDDLAQTVEYPTQDPGTDMKAQRFPNKSNRCRRQRQAGGLIQHLYGNRVFIQHRDPAQAGLSVRTLYFHGLIQAHIHSAAKKHQRPFDTGYNILGD